MFINLKRTLIAEILQVQDIKLYLYESARTKLRVKVIKAFTNIKIMSKNETE